MRAFGVVLAASMLVLPLAAAGQPGTDSVRILAAMRKSAADWNRATEGPTTPQIETDVTADPKNRRFCTFDSRHIKLALVPIAA